MNNSPDHTGVVLAIDDTPGNLRVLLECLGGAGHEVLVATDGESGIATARYSKPDLILLDVMMPGMNGHVACTKLKEDPATAHIPVIFMTALSETDEKVRAFALGAVDYVTKPFEEAELLARVQTHLTVSRLRVDLQKRNDQLQELNRLKNEFMGMAAHDIRNPLASVMACADLVETIAESAPPEKIRMFAGQISGAARRINAIITNLLDVNAIDSGQRRMSIQSHDLVAVVARVAQQNAIKADSKNIAIKLPPHSVSRFAAIDESAAEQVLDNIISNAVKYSPPGTTVTIHLSDSAEAVRVDVVDQGPGLSPEDQAKMFGKFCRLAPKPTAGEPSTGLGLWIVKQLTESMHGTIRCTSALGQGSTFTVTWPARPAASAAASAA
ncbi:hybrid sensor histidine kinase/response regulator [Opitutales bacterium ASA1]|uniref:hybrid sensor histidine kinase/response regulator n=1 Tax=Congregicoccus parvus TaxID=3081749 RepID=UPI002B317487|nr:hybrid sensor histidine kinase/response regulator [Opitutales bacterium ASA1]